MTRPTLRDVHVDQPLSNLSVGYSNAEYIANQIFPVVTVQKKSDVYFTFDKSQWFRRRAAHRAPGTKAQRADYGITTASYNCLNYALAKAIPDEVRANADVPLRPDVEAVEFTTDALLLDLEARVAALTTACGSWASASNPGTTWEDATSTPLEDIDNLVNAIVKQIGRRPNVAVTSWGVWQELKHHPDLLDLVKHTRPGMVQMSDIADFFGFDKFLVGMALEDSAQEGATASLDYIWGLHLWAGYVPNAPALREPAAGYVLSWGGRKVERFREDQEHQDIVSVEEHLDEVITASDAGGGYYTVVTL